MAQFILHHYAKSPYSEKIRLLLGYAKLPWTSVETSMVMPRKLLMPLSGGYRRIPIAQCGADIYCDTRIITPLVAKLGAVPEVYVDTQESLELNAFADAELFRVAISSLGEMKYLRNLGHGLSVWAKVNVMLDRFKMAKGTSLANLPSHEGRKRLTLFLEEFEQQLATPFRFGESPSIADFSIYHALWFVRDQARAPFVEPFPKVMEWMNRMALFGHGNCEPMSALSALQVAKDSQPMKILERSSHDLELVNNVVLVTPSDYGKIPVQGELVFSGATKRVIKSMHKLVGTVHIHFPVEGFVVERA